MALLPSLCPPWLSESGRHQPQRGEERHPVGEQHTVAALEAEGLAATGVLTGLLPLARVGTLQLCTTHN